jgi:tripartite ATP-independent transporter DctP family solute receptor
MSPFPGRVPGEGSPKANARFEQGKEEKKMGSKRSKVSGVVVGLLFLIGAAGSWAADAPKFEFRMGHVTQPAHSWHKTSLKFAELVGAKTKGQVKVTVYPAAQLGGDREMFEAIQLGTLDMGLVSVAPMGAFTPALNGLLLPFLFENYDTLKKVMVSPQTRELLGSLDEVGVKGYAVMISDFRHFVNNKRPISKLDDLKGLKLRVVEAPLYVDMFRALGVSVTALPYAELYTALKTGVIDGAELNHSSLWTMKLYEVVKYVSHTTFFFPSAVVMNLKQYQGLPPDIQKAISDAAWETVPYNLQIQIEEDQTTEKLLKEKGMVMNDITDMAPFKKAEEPVYEKYMARDKRVPWFVKEVQKMAAEKK